MPVIRTYECLDCLTVFEVTLDSGNDGDPDCPNCNRVLEWRPGMFSIATNKSKAMNVTQQIMEEDYGLTNWKDGNREGDVAAIIPSETRAQRDARERATAAVDMELAKAKPALNDAQAEAIKGFWGAGTPAAPPAINPASLLAGAKSGPQGHDAMAMLHKAKPPFRFKVVARG